MSHCIYDVITVFVVVGVPDLVPCTDVIFLSLFNPLSYDISSNLCTQPAAYQCMFQFT
jgi:hypothetical protein